MDFLQAISGRLSDLLGFLVPCRHIGACVPFLAQQLDVCTLMRIWVDADACPVVVKEILFRAADRTGVQLTLVANQPLGTPPSPNIKTLQVPQGFDVADDEIVRRLDAGDLVITSDIPLAAEVIAKGGHALSPRGEMHSTENIRARLNMRDFLDTMRASGVQPDGGPAAFSQRDKQAFANNLDRFLTKFSEPR
jgi:uncharacterized protein YaiI (UPF0178 family)